MIEKGAGAPKPKEMRDVWFIGGKRSVPIYDRADLKSGHDVKGPALIEEAASVTVLEEGHHLTMHEHGHMLISVAGK